MMSASEVYNSLKSNMSDRIKSPFYGAFVFSWLVFNWKPILILVFSKKSIYVVIEEVSTYSDLHRQFFYPIASTLVLVFLMPVISALYSFFSSGVGHLSDSGSGLRSWLNERAEIKRNNKRESIQKEHEEKITKVNADIAANKANEERATLESERAMREMADLPTLKSDIDRLKYDNSLLHQTNQELLFKLKRLFSGESPSNELLPAGLRPGAQMQFYTEVERIKLEREAKQIQEDNT